MTYLLLQDFEVLFFLYYRIHVSVFITITGFIYFVFGIHLFCFLFLFSGVDRPALRAYSRSPL